MGGFARLCVVSLVLVLVACSKRSDEGAPAAASASAPAVASAPPPIPPCDADAAWGADFPENGDDAALAAHERAVTQKIAGWTPECRRKALVTLCEYGCGSGEDGISDVLVNASPTPAERQAVLKYRLDRNTIRAKKWRDLYARTKAIVDHALAIQSSTRSSAYTPPNPTAEQLAEQLANGDPCMQRMKADDAKIDPVEAELEREETMTWLKALVFAPLRGLLGQAHSCGDCSDDRSACKSLRSDLKDAEKDLVEFEKRVAVDKKLISGAQ